jgi:hypothetical protein
VHDDLHERSRMQGRRSLREHDMQHDMHAAEHVCAGTKVHREGRVRDDVLGLEFVWDEARVRCGYDLQRDLHGERQLSERYLL